MIDKDSYIFEETDNKTPAEKRSIVIGSIAKNSKGFAETQTNFDN